MTSTTTGHTPPIRPRRVSWWERGPGLALQIIALVLLVGTVGYVVIERWSVWDAFYMTTITVTTVGYRELHELSRGGQVFTALLALGGVAATLYTLSLLVATFVEGGLRVRWERRRQENMIDDLRHHFIVCGYGRIGSVIVEEFRRQNVPFVVVEQDGERVQSALDVGSLAVEGDASNEDVLKRLHIDRARGLIAAVGTDADNVYTILSARLLRPDLFIIGRAENEDARRKLLRAGADRVISPYRIGGFQIAQTALRPAVVDFVQLATRADSLELVMEQVRIDKQASIAGRSIRDAGLRQRYGVLVVGIQRPDGQMEFDPSPETLLTGGDQLVVLGRPETLRELETAARD